MGLETRATCPSCNTPANVQLADEGGLADAVIKASSEEVILEISCKEDDCDRVWRSVYSFAGNQ